MVLANQNAKLTGPDQGFLVPRLVLIRKPWERGWALCSRKKGPWQNLGGPGPPWPPPVPTPLQVSPLFSQKAFEIYKILQK
jgi:hypothetical protein